MITLVTRTNALSSTVSVCVPTYNADLDFLSALVRSVQVQNLDGVDMVIMDDHSHNHDQIVELVAGTNIRVALADGPKGMVQNWNRAVRASAGDFFVLPGQDDLLAPDALSEMVRYAVEFDLDVLLTHQAYIDESGNRSLSPSKAITAGDVFPAKYVGLTPETAIMLGLVYGNILGDPVSVLVRRSAFDKVGGYSEGFEHAADLEFLLRSAAGRLRLGRAPIEVAMRRIHESNLTLHHVQSGASARDRLELHKRYSHTLPTRYAQSRSTARVLSHWAYDFINGGVGRRPLPAMRLMVRPSMICSMLDEVMENLGKKTPIGRLLVEMSAQNGGCS